MLDELTGFLDHHLKAVQFLMSRCDWDLFMFDLMATDRIQHELWHVWDPTHRAAAGARDRARRAAAGLHRLLAGARPTASARSRRRCRPTRR